MHCFTAKTSCAVLDVLGPPYNDAEKRHCSYYNTFPCASNSGMLLIPFYNLCYLYFCKDTLLFVDKCL